MRMQVVVLGIMVLTHSRSDPYADLGADESNQEKSLSRSTSGDSRCAHFQGFRAQILSPTHAIAHDLHDRDTPVADMEAELDDLQGNPGLAP